MIILVLNLFNFFVIKKKFYFACNKNNNFFNLLNIALKYLFLKIYLDQILFDYGFVPFR